MTAKSRARKIKKKLAKGKTDEHANARVLDQERVEQLLHGAEGITPPSAEEVRELFGLKEIIRDLAEEEAAIRWEADNPRGLGEYGPYTPQSQTREDEIVNAYSEHWYRDGRLPSDGSRQA